MKEERSIGGEKTMSSTNNNYKLEEGDDTMMCCDCCGIAVDDIKVKTCSANKLVRYCSIDIDCQKDHRPKHKKACKKRAAELRDELSFKQPESSHNGDCLFVYCHGN
jgi:hypothetical protein